MRFIWAVMQKRNENYLPVETVQHGDWGFGGRREMDSQTH